MSTLHLYVFAKRDNILPIYTELVEKYKSMGLPIVTTSELGVPSTIDVAGAEHRDKFMVMSAPAIQGYQPNMIWIDEELPDSPEMWDEVIARSFVKNAVFLGKKPPKEYNVK